MKVFTLFLAALGGAGFLFRSQLQPIIAGLRHSTAGPSHHQAPEGIYYLRTTHNFTGGEGSVRWAPGQELWRAAHTADDGDSLTLTDGQNIAEVLQTELTRDVEDAAALRHLEASGQDAARQQAMQAAVAREQTVAQDAARQQMASQQAAFQQAEAARQAGAARIVPGQFHPTTLDAPSVRTGLPANIVSTASAPVLYPVYRTVVIEPSGRPAANAVNVQQSKVQRRVVPPVSTPAPTRY